MSHVQEKDDRKSIPVITDDGSQQAEDQTRNDSELEAANSQITATKPQSMSDDEVDDQEKRSDIKKVSEQESKLDVKKNDEKDVKKSLAPVKPERAKSQMSTIEDSKLEQANDSDSNARMKENKSETMKLEQPKKEPGKADISKEETTKMEQPEKQPTKIEKPVVAKTGQSKVEDTSNKEVKFAVSEDKREKTPVPSSESKKDKELNMPATNSVSERRSPGRVHITEEITSHIEDLECEQEIMLNGKNTSDGDDQRCVLKMDQIDDEDEKENKRRGPLFSLSKNLRRRYICGLGILVGGLMLGIIIFGVVRASMPEEDNVVDTLAGTAVPVEHEASSTPHNNTGMSTESPMIETTIRPDYSEPPNVNRGNSSAEVINAPDDGDE